MRHHRKGRIFSRTSEQRRALLNGLASSLVVRGKIKTTAAKAKELRPFVERLVTRAKIPTIANRRLIARYLSPVVTQRIIKEAEAHAQRPGGYTRITKVGVRKSDSARMAIIEFVK